MKCQFCNKEKGNYTLKSGKVCCMPYPAQCPSVREKNSKKTSLRLKKEYENGTRVSHFKMLNDGKIWKGRHHSEKTKSLLSNLNNGKTMSDEFKHNRSIEMQKRYASGWESTAGRCKKIDYESPVAGKIKVDGNWELNVAKYLDKINVKWQRNTKRFKYTNLSDNISTYCPDFYIYDWNTYLEVKGYETQLDKCKWKQFKEPLIIWRKKDLKEKQII